MHFLLLSTHLVRGEHYAYAVLLVLLIVILKEIECRLIFIFFRHNQTMRENKDNN